MILKPMVVVTLEFMGKPRGVYWLYETDDARAVEEVVSGTDLPDHQSASLLLCAAAAYLTGSPTGQIVQAAISSCKNRINQTLNEKGNLSTFEDELPF